MARTRETPSVSGYFRQMFRDNADWLSQSSNEEIKQRWHEDHPGEEWSLKIQQNMSNVKSQLRKQMGLGKARRRGRPRKAAAAPAAHGEQQQTATPRPRPSYSGTLDKLERAIDDCLSLARQQENPDLEGVVRSLRSARNAVVWAMGEPNTARG